SMPFGWGPSTSSQGPFLSMKPSGGKLWRVNCHIFGKEKALAVGVYPAVGLAEARRQRDEARSLCALPPRGGVVRDALAWLTGFKRACGA
ncbi:Arm DNA-binding domain-containing protein, partial [Novosphingobium soli]